MNNNKNYATTIVVNKTPEEVFTAVNNVRGWWSENIEGDTDKLNAEYLYHYKDVHTCKMKVTELIPAKKIVWHVLENDFSFTTNKDEWKGNNLVFEIIEKNGNTQLTFTQYGLTPSYECYEVCNDAWTGFIKNSLHKLITAGKGEPTPKDKDGVFNEELIEKWKLKERRKSDNFSYSFDTLKSPEKIFESLLDVRGWWSGLYGEKIEGCSIKLNDEFTFSAGDGAHYSKQKLIELVPNKKITWLVTDSNLSFLQKPNEWTGSKISFDIIPEKTNTQVVFKHEGLIPKFECYKDCSNAWALYLNKLKDKLNEQVQYKQQF